MDPLTHTLTGAALADAGLGRCTRYATATLLVGANLPDLDVLAYVHGSDAALGFRRGWTHGVLALAVLPILLTLTVMAWDRLRRGRYPDHDEKPLRPGMILGLAYLSVISHPLLDLLNNYGVRLLMPWQEKWFYGDAVFIFDPWIWLVLGGAVFLNHSASSRGRIRWGALAVVVTVFVFITSHPPNISRVSVVPRSWAFWTWLFALGVLVVLRRRRGDDREEAALRRARRALAVAGCYVLAMLGGTAAVSHELGVRLAAEGGKGSYRWMVSPVPLDPLERMIVVETPDGYRFASHHWLAEERLRIEPRTMPRGDAPPAVETAVQASCVAGFVRWTRFPAFETEETDHGWEVHLLDVRYVRQRTRGFGGARVVLDGELRPRCGTP